MMFGIASKKELREELKDVRQELRAAKRDRESLIGHLAEAGIIQVAAHRGWSFFDGWSFFEGSSGILRGNYDLAGICEKQREIVTEVLSLRAELDALRKRETKTQNGLEGVATHSSLNYRCNRDRLDTVEGKLGLLLERLGLEATWAEAAWELREVEK